MTDVLPPPVVLDTVVVPSRRSAADAYAAAADLLAGQRPRLLALHRDDGHGRCAGCVVRSSVPCLIARLAATGTPPPRKRPAPAGPLGLHGFCVACEGGGRCPAHGRIGR